MRLVFLALALVSACFAQNARDYYKELYAAGGLDRMADQYVCFDDHADLDTFFLFGESKLLRESMMENGTFGKLSKADQAGLKKDFLTFRGYVKGVPHPERDFMDRKDDSWVSGKFMLDKNTPAQVRFSIVWETLRYKRAVERIRPDGSSLPMATRFGRCEEVAPDIAQHGN